MISKKPPELINNPPLTCADIDPRLLKIMRFLYEKYFRVEASGLENIPSQGGALLVCNHSGTLPYDALMLIYAFSQLHPAHRITRVLVDNFVFDWPLLSKLIKSLGGIQANVDNARSYLANEEPVLVFPEGVKGLGKLYKDKYKLVRFGRGGFVKLCLQTRVPMIPIALVGPEEIQPLLIREKFLAKIFDLPYIPITPLFPILGPLGLMPLPSKWYLQVLPPIDFSMYEPGAEKDRVLVAQLTQLVKKQIQEAVFELLKKRKNVWLG